MTSAAVRRSRAPLSSGARIWLFTAALAAMCVPVGFVAARPTAPYLTALHLPWWGVAALYCAAELAVVHLYFRRDAHTFSMTETALVVTLLFAAPRALLVGQAIGCMGALIYRHQSRMKFCFNIAQFTLATSCGMIVFRELAPRTATLSAGVWAASFAGALTTGLMMGSLVIIAISLAESHLDVSRLPMVLVLSFVSALTNASLALVAATLLRSDAAAMVLLGIPSVTVYLAYRAYLREREKHESLEFLYQSTRILNETPELEDAILRLLHQARGMFKAENAAVMFNAPGRERMLRTAVEGDGVVHVMEPVTNDATNELWQRMTGGARACRLLRRSDSDPVTQQFLAAYELRDAMVGVLSGERNPYGLVVVGNRLGEVTSFDLEDLRLFETLANHASVALENGRLEQSLAQLRELEQRLKQMAYHDPLTGLPNRSLFTDRVDAALARLRGTDDECAVLFIDLDDFKTVNDTLGHAAGDDLLRAVAERLNSCLRPGDTAARLGGDEFAVLLEDVTGPGDGERIAQRIGEALRRPVHCADQDVAVRASVGIAPSSGFDSADHLLRNADLAMYMAKSDGKGSFKLFEPGMAEDVTQRHKLKADLTRAVDSGEFCVYYQPIVDLQTGVPVAFEALARWQHPQHGLLGPDTFIPMAEETGLIATIGTQVMRLACAQVSEWQQLFPGEPAVAVTVNLSPLQVRLPELVGEVAQTIGQCRLAPGSLILEITESLMLDDAETTLDTLHRLRALGVRLALDDFGTGYSSLGHLRRLPVDLLKIAKTFVDDLDGASDATAFASAILALGHTLGLTTLAEGVEAPWQASELRRLGCTLAQGYHFARPLSADDAELFLRRYHEPAADMARIIPFPA